MNEAGEAHFRTVVIPLDGSPFGEHALPLALAIEARTHARLEIVLVHGTVVPDRYIEGLPSIEWWDAELRREGRAYLDAIRERLSTAGATAHATLLDGPPIAETILRHAGDVHADLILMSTHGRGGLARAWLGSVADEVARSSSIPLLLVRPGPAAAALEPVPAPRHMVLALGPADDASAARHAAPLARIFDARITLLRIVPPPLRIDGHALHADEARHRAVAAHAAEVLNGIRDTLNQSGLAARTRVLSHTQPANAILEFAAAENADLIIVGAGHRSGPGRFLLGSTTDKVVRGATVPILLVPRPDA